jgi:MFS family permease
VAVLSAASFAGYAGITGLGFLVAIRSDDAFALSSGGRGLLLAGFGFAGMLAGRPAGLLVDRLGRIQVALAGAAACAVLVVLMGEAASVAALAALWFAAGAASTFVWAALNTMTVEAVPANRAGATSVVSAFKFAGNAAAPAMWLPLYGADVRLAFLGAGVMAAATGALTLRLR